MIPLATELNYEIDPELTGRDRLKRLREIKSELISKVRAEEAKRNELRRVRDQQNQQVKELFQEASLARERRDEVNEDVKLNKALRDMRKEDVDKALAELVALEDQMKDINSSKPVMSYKKKNSIVHQIKELEAKLETTPNLNPQQEKEMMDRIEKLYNDIDEIVVVDEKRDEIFVIKKRLRTLRNEAMTHHKEVRKLANQSQEYHDEMLEKITEARKIRTSADKAHKEVLALTDIIKSYRKEINAITQETDAIRKKLGEETPADRKKRKQAEAKKREEDLDTQALEILERYKSGEKLGFEEFKLLISRGLLKDEN